MTADCYRRTGRRRLLSDLLLTKGEYQLKLTPPPFVPGMETAVWCVRRRRMRVFMWANVFQHSGVLGSHAENKSFMPVASSSAAPSSSGWRAVSLLVNCNTILRPGSACAPTGGTVLVLGAAGR